MINPTLTAVAAFHTRMAQAWRPIPGEWGQSARTARRTHVGYALAALIGAANHRTEVGRAVRDEAKRLLSAITEK